MAPLSTHDVRMHQECNNSNDNLRLDAYLKPNNDFNESSGRLRLAVRFLECNSYCEIPSREDYSREEMSAMWYSESEYNYIKTINTATLRLMTSGQDLNPSIHCVRGLEVRTMEGWENRHRNKKLTRNAVFQEQDMQRSEQTYDDELFARVSEDASSQARQQALERGKYDQLQACIIHNNDNVQMFLEEKKEVDEEWEDDSISSVENEGEDSFLSFLSLL